MWSNQCEIDVDIWMFVFSAPTSGACSLWYAWWNELLFSYLLYYPHLWKKLPHIGTPIKTWFISTREYPSPMPIIFSKRKDNNKVSMLGHDNEVFSHHFAQIETCHCTSAKEKSSCRRFLSYMYPTAFHFQAASVAMTNLLESHSDFQARTSPPCGSHGWLNQQSTSNSCSLQLIAILHSEMLL